MNAVISERAFEEAIEPALLRHGPDALTGDASGVAEEPAPFDDPWRKPGGYHRRRSEDYDRELCLLPGDVLDFVLATQPKEWEKLSQHYGARVHRSAEEFIKQGESKTLEFKSTLRWNLKEDRKDDKQITHAALKTIAAFLNTEGGDLLLGVADNGTVVGIDHDRLDNDDKFMLHLAQVVRNGLGARAGTCIDPKVQIVDGKGVCVVSCQRSPEPVFLQRKGVEAERDGDFYVRSGPGTVKLSSADTAEYIRTRFGPVGLDQRASQPPAAESVAPLDDLVRELDDDRQER